MDHIYWVIKFSRLAIARRATNAARMSFIVEASGGRRLKYRRSLSATANIILP